MSTLTSPRFVEQWRHAGLGENLPTLIEAYTATLQRIEAERRDAATRTEQVRHDRAEHIAAGKAGKLPALPDERDYDSARRIAERTFWRQVRQLGDTLVDELDDAHGELLAEAAPLVPVIGRLTSDSQAVDRTTTPEAREAWTRLGGLWRDRALLLELLYALLVDEVIPDATLPAEKRELTEYRRFARPAGAGRSGFSPVAAKTPEPLRMATLVRDAAQTRPGVYRLDEARANRAAADQAAFADARLRDGGAGVTDPHRNKAIDAAKERQRARQAAELETTPWRG